MPDPIRIVTDPYGNRLPKNKICKRCGEHAKFPREKYCEDCLDIIEQENDDEEE